MDCVTSTEGEDGDGHGCTDLSFSPYSGPTIMSESEDGYCYGGDDSDRSSGEDRYQYGRYERDCRDEMDHQSGENGGTGRDDPNKACEDISAPYTVHLCIGLNPNRSTGQYNSECRFLYCFQDYTPIDDEYGSGVDPGCDRHLAANRECRDNTDGTSSNHGAPYGDQIHMNSSDPVEIFRSFFDEDLMHNIVTWTNSCGMLVKSKSGGTRHDTTLEEMRRFLGLCILMGNIRFPSLKHCWSTAVGYRHPVFAKTMPRNRFDALLRSLCFHDDATRQTASGMHRIEGLQGVFEKFNKAFTPGGSFSPNSPMVTWHAKLLLRYYNKSKRPKNDVSVYDLCTPDGYILRVVAHVGERSIMDPVATVPFAVVTQLMKTFIPRNDAELVMQICDDPKTLNLMRHYQAERQGLMVYLNIRLRNDMLCGNVTFTKSKDMRNVLALSTNDDDLATSTGDERHLTMPYMIVSQKPVFDSENQTLPYCSIPRTSVKWFVKFFFHVLDASLWNGAILHSKITGKECNHLEFRDAIFNHLLGLDATTPKSIPSHRLVKTTRVRCRYCFLDGKKRRSTRYVCDACEDNKGIKIGLCPAPCFDNWHKEKLE